MAKSSSSSVSLFRGARRADFGGVRLVAARFLVAFFLDAFVFALMV
jgi:hypothetical protein